MNNTRRVDYARVEKNNRLGRIMIDRAKTSVTYILRSCALIIVATTAFAMVPATGYADILTCEYIAKWMQHDGLWGSGHDDADRVAFWKLRSSSAYSTCKVSYYDYFGDHSKKASKREKDTPAQTRRKPVVEQPVEDTAEHDRKKNKKLWDKARREAENDASLDPWSSQKSEKSNSKTSAQDCLEIKVSGYQYKIKNVCEVVALFKYWDEGRFNKGKIEKINPGDTETLSLTTGKVSYRACMSDCDIYNLEREDAIQPASKADSSTNNWNTKVGKNKNNERGGEAMDIDPDTGRACVTVTRLETERLYTGSLKHNYQITNTCDKGFNVHMVTRAGWKGYVMISNNSKTGWFCTDGAKANKDCGGGIQSYYFD